MKAWLWAIICPIIAYLIGSINFPFILTKLKTKKNLWEVGTKNLGGFNAMLQTNAVFGAFAGFLDLCKGFGSVLTVMLLPFDDTPLFPADPKRQISWHSIICILVATTVTLGHNFSIFLKFRGGRGLGCSMGILWLTNPLVLVMAFSVNLIIVITTRFVRPAQFLSFFIVLPATFFLPIFPPWVPIELRSGLMLGLLATGLVLVMLPKYTKPFIDMFRGKEYKVGKDKLEFQDN